MARRVLDVSEDLTLYYHHSAHDDTFAVEELYNVGPTIEIAKDVAELGGPMVDSDGLRLQRIIPAHVSNRAYREGWHQDKEAWRRWANSHEGLVFAVEHKGRKQRL